VVPSSAPAAPGAPGRYRSNGRYPVADHVPRSCAGVPADDAAALWLDPREPQGLGESSVPTLEASSAQVSGRRPHKTWAAKRPSGPSAEDCLSSEGGHRRLCANTWEGTEGSAPLRTRPSRRELSATTGPALWGTGRFGDRRWGNLVFAAEAAPPFHVKKASLFSGDPIYSSGYIRRVLVKGADTQRNEAHGMCFEFAGMDAG
jgi:hypothetical protein